MSQTRRQSATKVSAFSIKNPATRFFKYITRTGETNEAGLMISSFRDNNGYWVKSSEPLPQKFALFAEVYQCRGDNGLTGIFENFTTANIYCRIKGDSFSGTWKEIKERVKAAELVTFCNLLVVLPNGVLGQIELSGKSLQHWFAFSKGKNFSVLPVFEMSAGTPEKITDEKGKPKGSVLPPAFLLVELSEVELSNWNNLVSVAERQFTPYLNERTSEVNLPEKAEAKNLVTEREVLSDAGNDESEIDFEYDDMAF